MHADFIDSNLFVYLFDHTDDRRRGIAREIVERGIAEGTDAVAFFDTLLSRADVPGFCPKTCRLGNRSRRSRSRIRLYREYRRALGGGTSTYS